MRPLGESKHADSSSHVYRSLNGSYSTYSGTEEDVNNGKFSNRVFDSQNMPKNATLPQDELNKFKRDEDSSSSQN